VSINAEDREVLARHAKEYGLNLSMSVRDLDEGGDETVIMLRNPHKAPWNRQQRGYMQAIHMMIQFAERS
jgi:hypothetical protein